MNLGNSIKEFRIRKDWSQMDLAGATGISQTSVSQIENGKKFPSQKTIKAICKALEITEGSLYVGALEFSDVPPGNRNAFIAIESSLNFVFKTKNHAHT